MVGPIHTEEKGCDLSKVKARIRKTTQKYGIEIPMSVENTYEIDTKNNNDLWQKEIDKEMTNVGVAFQVLEEGEKAPPGWSKASGHIVFDVKMDFMRKAQWVLDGHRQSDPKGSTYAGVVSRESVRIAFTYATLNELDVCATNI